MATHRGPLALLVVSLLCLPVPPAAGAQPAAGDRTGLQGGALRWGGDAEGGAPYVEADPGDPSIVRGFDVEVANLLARGLGVRPQFVQVAFATIDASVSRGDCDVGMSGVEDTPARRAQMLVSRPYFEFREVLTVRRGDSARFRTLADLRGRRVGSLGGSVSYERLLAVAPSDGIVPVSYDDDVHPYTDLKDGRLDAVLLDHIIAARAERRTGGLFTQPAAVGVGYYIVLMARGRDALRDGVDAILGEAMRDGRLEQIYRRWGIWDDAQAAFLLHEASRSADTGGTTDAAPTGQAPDVLSATWRYFPAIVRAAGITVVLSCLAMALAVGLGVLVAAGRLYGRLPVRLALTAYVEVTRGTPVLLQLFVIYYGLSSVVRLPAFVAALIGLGVNYAAYESEIYRGALIAVPVGQLEAARTLGLSERQVFGLVRAPQAFRLALAPMTNDFVALLKDSSLVSVITVIELTKQTQIFAANVGTWVVPGALCAAMYLAMSLPLSRAARRLEHAWKLPQS